ncbi:MAG: hypothetical protein WCF92_02200 [bacterium]
MEGISNIDNQAEILDRNLSFVLKLAQAENISDEEAVEGIETTIKKTIEETGRPEFIDRIDPGTFHSETKLISDKAKNRLNIALEKYTNSF